MNKSRAPSEIVCVGLEFGRSEGSSHSCLQNDTVLDKK